MTPEAALPWTWLSFTALALIVLALAGAGAVLSYRRLSGRARGAPSFSLPRGALPSPLDLLVDPAQAAHPGQQGLFNLLEGEDAFATRVQACRQAGRSLDIITYIWSADLTGWLLMGELIAAARRGVRVRLLLDDVHVQGLDPVFLGLGRHAGIEVRLFNPLRSRSTSGGAGWRQAVEFALGLSRFNRRLHSKAWIVDGRLAILGGRNVGDVYFGAVRDGRQEAEDADVVLVGSKVAEVAAIFDLWWNLGPSLPIRRLWPAGGPSGRTRRPGRGFRWRLQRHLNDPEAQALLAKALEERSAAARLVERLTWTAPVQILSDPVEKALGPGALDSAAPVDLPGPAPRDPGPRRPARRATSPWLSAGIETMLRQARHRVQLMTPYFVPGDEGLALLSDLRARGVQVDILTNSLATTDIALVHGAYSAYRHPLLAMGVRLHELARRPGLRRSRAFLHSKVFLVDGRQALIGSANFDLRSAKLNIEIGLVMEEPTLIAELEARFARQSGPGLAWEVRAQDGRLVWHGAEGQTEQVEPHSSALRLGLAGLMRVLPHDFL